MAEFSIYQIFYSEQTRQACDPGFLPLDYLTNDRPDWREYWPIRRFILSQGIKPDHYYGFLSPKFQEKTGLSATSVFEFLKKPGEAFDVALFGPFFDQGAFFLNPVEQATTGHGDSHNWDELIRQFFPDFVGKAAVTTSQNTVYCNYFVASGRFWEVWFNQCEQIFALAENPTTELGRALNGQVSYADSRAPMKPFVIERVATLLLATQPQWRVRVYDPLQLPFDSRFFIPRRKEMMVLDALKLAYQARDVPAYLETYILYRNQIIRQLQAQGLMVSKKD